MEDVTIEKLVHGGQGLGVLADVGQCLLDEAIDRQLAGRAQRDGLEFAFDLADAGKRILQRGALLHQFLRLLGIVPEIGIFGELVQFGQTGRGCIDVKDASSAARPTA